MYLSFYHYIFIKIYVYKTSPTTFSKQKFRPTIRRGRTDPDRQTLCFSVKLRVHFQKLIVYVVRRKQLQDDIAHPRHSRHNRRQAEEQTQTPP